ncbi:hypothetical protein N2152v2_004167 [Parachlorella kessleri]
MPWQLHLALTGDPTELRISWATRGKGCPSSVHFWAADNNNDGVPQAQQLLGTTAEYDNSDFCASPARDYEFDRPKYLHHVTLAGLIPGGRYIYRVAGSDREVPFRAPPPIGPDSSFSFLAYGDMGESEHPAAKSPGASDTAERVLDEVKDGADLIVHVGDISYANGRPEIWDSFMEAIEPFASRVPYMVAIGNHEYDYRRHDSSKDPSGADKPYDPDWGNFGNDSGGECGVATTKTFAMPDIPDLGYWPQPNCSSASGSGDSSVNCSGGWPGPRNPTLGPNGAAASAGAAGTVAAASGEADPENHHHHRANPPFWYSFSYGSVHFTVLSTEHDVTPGSKQYKWLKHDLRRVDRCRTPWLVVAMHRPMYVVFPHKSNRIVGEHLREALEDLLNEYEVDLVLSGHVHSYSRTCNVLDWRCADEESEGGMTHVTVGCAGRKLSSVEHEQPDWLEFAESRFGFGRVTVRDGSSLTWDYIRTEDGRVHDSVTLYNKREGRRGCGRGNGQPGQSSNATGGGGSNSSSVSAGADAMGKGEELAGSWDRCTASAGGTDKGGCLGAGDSALSWQSMEEGATRGVSQSVAASA